MMGYMVRLRNSLVVGVVLVIMGQFAVATARTAAYGPAASISAIKHDVPFLLASSLGPRPKPALDLVYTDGSNAAVAWHSGKAAGLVLLRIMRGRWWWVAAASTVDSSFGYWTPLKSPGSEVSVCGANLVHSPTAGNLLSAGLIARPFVTGLEPYLRVLRSGAPDDHLLPSCDYPSLYQDVTDGYNATFDSPDVLDQVSLHGGAPADSEMPPVYFEFTLSTHSSRPVAVKTGASIHVWFPFVLNQHERYSLMLTGADEDLASLTGYFKDNTLTFPIPAITLTSNVPLHGRIVRQGS